MFERFTGDARRVVVLAQGQARALRHYHVGTEHLSLDLLGEGDGAAARILGEWVCGPMTRATGAEEGTRTVTVRGDALRHCHIETSLVLLGRIREGKRVAAKVRSMVD